MQDLLNQIRAASRANLFYVALMSALALPDICGALESPNGQANGQRYAEWFDRHVAPSYPRTLTGRDCYNFRCSMLHQGRMQHPASSFERIFFVEPSAARNVFHNNVFNRALNINVRIFVEDIVVAAEKWLAAASKTAQFQANYPLFVSRHADGLLPYIAGLPVIG